MNPIDPQRYSQTHGLQPNAPSTKSSSSKALTNGQGLGPSLDQGFAQALAKASPNEASKANFVTVEKGDTLISLTRRQWMAQQQSHSATRSPPTSLNPTELYKLSLQVAKNNGLSDPNLIRVGQQLDFSSVVKPEAKPSADPLASRPEAKPPTDTLASRQDLPPAAGERTSAPAPASAKPQKVAVVGDSIALGIGGALIKQSGIAPTFAEGRKFLNQVTDQLVVDATGGHSSPQILRKLNANPQIQNADLAIISVGTNDLVNSTVNAYYTPERITANLQKIRDNMHAKSNLWVLPYDEKARDLVMNVAQLNGDQTLDLAAFQKADRYHPKNYSEIAKALSVNLTGKGSEPSSLQNAQSTPHLQAHAWPSTLSALMARAGSTRREP